jgi:hypothetical protein
MTCEPNAFVVQAPKLLLFSARELGPSAKESGEAVVASSSLHHQLLIVKDSKLLGKFSHH